MCGTAVNLITRVIGENERNGQNWYFLDDGIYGTFSGVIFDQWDFKLISFKDGKKIPATFAGPSCDSLDIMFRGKMTEPWKWGTCCWCRCAGLIHRLPPPPSTASKKPGR